MLSIGECSVGERRRVSPLSVVTIASKIIFRLGFQTVTHLLMAIRQSPKDAAAPEKGAESESSTEAIRGFLGPRA